MTFGRSIRTALDKFHIDRSRWPELAADRSAWRQTLENRRPPDAFFAMPARRLGRPPRALRALNQCAHVRGENQCSDGHLAAGARGGREWRSPLALLPAPLTILLSVVMPFPENAHNASCVMPCVPRVRVPRRPC